MSKDKIRISLSLDKGIFEIIEKMRVKRVHVDGEEVAIESARSYVVEKLVFMGAKLASSDLNWEKVNFSNLDTNQIKL